MLNFCLKMCCIPIEFDCNILNEVQLISVLRILTINSIKYNNYALSVIDILLYLTSYYYLNALKI